MPTAPDRDGRSGDPRRAEPDARAYARRIDCAEREKRPAAPPVRGGSPIEADPYGRARTRTR